LIGAVDPDEARRVAHHILGGRQYRASPTPRPLRNQLTWIGDRVHGIVDAIGRGLSHIPEGVGLAFAAAVLGTAIYFVVRYARSRQGRPDDYSRAAAAGADTAEDPRELERAADAAERAGRFDDALRLRFRAGLLRLGARGAIRYRPSVTTTEVRRALGSETFDELARTFEAVAYGGRDALEPDLQTARRDWPRVVAGAPQRPADEP
jgi:Domain of unknown function (DUF4129)